MTSKILIRSYIIVSGLFIVGTILSFYDFSYLGYYTDKIINWFWLGCTLLIIFRCWKRKLVKFYALSLFTLLLLSILPMAIPFFGIVNYFSTIGDYQQIQLNPTYRIERTKQGALSLPRVYIYERKGIFERNICRPVYSEIVEDVLNIDVFDQSINVDSLAIQSVKFIKSSNDSIEIEYKILNKVKHLWHKINNDDGY